MIQNLKECLLPISASILCVFPLAVFLQMLSPGLVLLRSGCDSNFRDGLKGAGGCILCAALLALVPLLLVFPSLGSTFVLPAQEPGPLPAPQLTPAVNQVNHVEEMPSSRSAIVGCMTGMTLAFLAIRWGLRRRVVRKAGKSLSHCSSREFISQERSESMTAVEHSQASPWHCVSLFLRDWLDDETGLLHFVNEMPRGSLQKFELQTELENNVIREDAKGTRRLRSFGRPVPFNYGCFPQTYRDPRHCDELHNAPGDNDPLDVIDVSSRALHVGELATCRPLGAVCLIDEGQADWKIFVTSQLDGPEASLRNMKDVEKLWPGRTMEILSWMDDFKQHQNTGATHLHYEVHDADVAMAIVRKDHEAWQQLLEEADQHGFARGHWVGGESGAAGHQDAGVLMKLR